MHRFSTVFPAFALLLALALSGCNDPKPETFVESGYDEQEMEEAIARARAEVDSFIKELTNPTGESHSVKAPIEDGGETEHFWLRNVTYRNGQFEGIIDNEPGRVSNVQLGQKWTVKKDEISDWMFLRKGKMHGNYTVRPLLVTMPQEEADAFRAMFADP